MEEGKQTYTDMYRQNMHDSLYDTVELLHKRTQESELKLNEYKIEVLEGRPGYIGMYRHSRTKGCILVLMNLHYRVSKGNVTFNINVWKPGSYSVFAIRDLSITQVKALVKSGNVEAIMPALIPVTSLEGAHRQLIQPRFNKNIA